MPAEDSLEWALRRAMLEALTPADLELIADTHAARKTRKGRERAADLRRRAQYLRTQKQAQASHYGAEGVPQAVKPGEQPRAG